ncbi:MAG: tyrosine-type recombinase/integrase [bacterium]|nr:tyrosine-type recombinase/integrase [bacterium]
MNRSDKSVVSYLSDFLDWIDVEKGLSSKTQENYGRFLKRFLDWLKKSRLENIKPHELTSDHLWQYRVFLARQLSPKTRSPLKKTTQNYYLIALRALLNYFAERDIVSLPSEKIKLAKDKGERQVRFLTLEQLGKLFSAIDTDKPPGLRDRAILESFFSTGMRIAELVSLDREQIKFSSGTQELELGIIGKGNRPRTVYFSGRALSCLRKYLATRNDKEKALFIHYRSKKNASSRLTPRAIEKMMKKYAITSGIPLFSTPHVLRHTFATDLLSKGVDLRIIQEFLGHKSITATQIYAHVTSKKLREVHEKFHGGNELKS